MAKIKIVFLVLPQVHLLDLAGPVQTFQEADEYVRMEYCSFDKSLTSSSGFPLGQLEHYRKIQFQPGDYLIVPGADVDYLLSKAIAAAKELLQWVRNAHAAGAQVCSVCTGAFFLGLTGLLDGRKCTTHWKRTAQLAAKFPAIKLQEDILFTEDDGVLTSAGVTAGIDLALYILSRMAGEHVSFKVARELLVYIRRDGDDSQQSVFMKCRNHIHSGIHKAQDYIQESIHKNVSLGQLAEDACMSTRSLTRTFKKETGVTVNQYVNMVRRARLNELLKQPDMSRKQMAKLCGLKSERQIIRLLKTM